MTTSKYSYLGTYHNASANIPPEHLLLLYLKILSSMYSHQNVLAFVDLQETKSQQHFISWVMEFGVQIEHTIATTTTAQTHVIVHAERGMYHRGR